MRIERATPADRAAVEALVAGADLPLEGLADSLERCVLARDGNAIVGVAAVERYGHVGLLRSVAVSAGRRGTGIGGAVVTAAEELARADGLTDLYLLTETAAGWFPRLGYEVVPREAAGAAVGDSLEFTTLCASGSIAMRKRLSPR